MCGIFGVFDSRRRSVGADWTPGERARFDSLRDRLAHRGPDGARTHQEPGVLLGHRRLSILDLSDAASQPMIAASGTVLVFNGEIYNFVELRRELELEGAVFRSSGDTIVLLEALERWGLQPTLKKIRGMFAFAVWRPHDDELWLARDHVGKKPLFFGRTGDEFIFASAVEPILAWQSARGRAPQLDPIAINHAMSSGWVPAPRTGIVGIEKLHAGSFCVITQASSARISPFWAVPFPEQRRPLESQTLDDLDRLFQQAVSRRLRSDVPVATFLSGGLDSSLVTAAAAIAHPSLVAFTARTGDGNDDELRLAEAIARHLRIEHRVIEARADLMDGLDSLVGRYGEAFCDSSAMPTAAICRQAGQTHRVVLTGDGGDEVQGGYKGSALLALRSLIWRNDRLNSTPGLLRRLVEAASLSGHHGPPDPMQSSAFRLLRLAGSPLAALTHRADGLDDSAVLMTRDARARLGVDEWREWMTRRIVALGAPTALDAQLGFEFAVYLADDLNVKVDVAAMASSVETRAPLLDIDFVEACWGVRTLDRVRPWARKRIIHALANRYLPHELLIKRKQGFSIPIARWLEETGSKEVLLEDLAARRTGLGEVLDEAKTLGTIKQCRAAGRESAELVWRLLALSRWSKWVHRTASESASKRLSA
jgi:asparagine synthase (glutamine-hydrolysing)